ncbi:MAG TPA: pyridoxamine 5'-phosphate oxidase family protein [Nocardioides sp.]|jgi:general stress protein 26|uniref:pyridoxamine 5'-phosphate oxidase family protein n=1 Tax=Nocardioides sp. TaxID=35761 RepID=UPI002E3074C5|nr:pyridoxamine 5'-phosphate oxidase family protein [Nocardioides sp.]HEX3929399.1 pyridoxamine 5'-phosphate oxidase family protein [Nocardioides sp.]
MRDEPTADAGQNVGSGSRDKLVQLMREMRVGMLTTFGPDGPRSVPMARQDVDPGAQLWFITARDTAHVRVLRAVPHVAVTFSSRDARVAATGRAFVIDDTDKVEQLWNSFAEAWLPGGPEDPNATLLRVDVEQAEYWDTPGSKVASLISFAKTKMTGATYDADHGNVEP